LKIISYEKYLYNQVIQSNGWFLKNTTFKVFLDSTTKDSKLFPKIRKMEVIGMSDTGLEYLLKTHSIHFSKIHYRCYNCDKIIQCRNKIIDFDTKGVCYKCCELELCEECGYPEDPIDLDDWGRCENCSVVCKECKGYCETDILYCDYCFDTMKQTRTR